MLRIASAPVAAHLKPELPDLSWFNIPKRGENIPNNKKIYPKARKYTQRQENIPNGHKIDQMAIKYTNIFHCKTLQNLP
jgi:hypothetical protein